MIKYFVWQCTVGNMSHIMNIVIFVYLVLLQIVGIILAIQTRKVIIKVLNDSKYNAAMICISSVVWITFLFVTFILPGSRINLKQVFFSGGLLLTTTAFLCLTFIPKVQNCNTTIVYYQVLFYRW